MTKSLGNAFRLAVRKTANVLTRKDSRSVLLIPHFNCINDGYDIINYRSDNVLCLFNGIIRDSRYDGWNIHIVYYDKEKLDSYLDYCRDFNPSRIHFIHCKDSRKYFKAFFSSAHIFTDHHFDWFRFRVRGQQIVCLSYFPGPFKDDFNILPTTKKGLAKERKVINLSYDWQVSVSDLCSALLSKDSLLHYSKFVPLGFPRNDIFYEDTSYVREAIFGATGIKASRIICYTPTHRDYESSERKFYDTGAARARSIWGEIDEDGLERMDSVLEEADAVVIAKLHPSQEKSVLSSAKSRRVFLYSRMPFSRTISLNEVLAASDILITDYTSAVYDFLHTDRPIIYYFYDYEKYRATRGFFIDPVEPVCAGYLAYDFSALLEGITRCCREDCAADKRKWLKDLFLLHQDGKSLERVMDRFLHV